MTNQPALAYYLPIQLDSSVILKSSLCLIYNADNILIFLWMCFGLRKSVKVPWPATCSPIGNLRYHGNTWKVSSHDEQEPQVRALKKLKYFKGFICKSLRKVWRSVTPFFCESIQHLNITLCRFFTLSRQFLWYKRNHNNNLVLYTVHVLGSSFVLSNSRYVIPQFQFIMARGNLKPAITTVVFWTGAVLKIPTSRQVLY
jgi:hypothetical protein